MQKELTATQKLLENLRSSNVCTLPKTSSTQKSFFSLKRKKVNISLDLREKYILICGLEENNLLFLEKINYPQGITKFNPTPDFENWFKNLSKKLKKLYPHTFFQLIIPANAVKTFFFSIPKVSSKNIPKTALMALKKQLSQGLENFVYDFQVIGKTHIDGTEKIEIFAYVVEKTEIIKYKNLALQSKLTPLGLTSYQFALADIFIKEKAKNIAYLFIGSDWSRIDIYNHGRLIFNREIKTGFNSFAEEIIHYFAKEEEQENLLELENSLELNTIQNFFAGKITEETPLTSLDDQKLLEIISPALTRLILQIKRSFQYYNTKLNKKNIEKLYISSIYHIPYLFFKEIENSLEVKTRPLAPLREKIVNSTQRLELSLIEEMDFAPVIASALSSPKSVNFLLTTKDKKQQKFESLLRTGSSILFTLIFLILFIFHIQLKNKNKNLENQITHLANTIQTLNPPLNQSILKSLATKLSKEELKIKNSLQLFEYTSILKEVANLTPKEIKFKQVILQDKKLALKGVIFLEPEKTELFFTDYLLELKKSPFIENVVIKNKDFFNQSKLNFHLEINLK